MSLVVTGKDKGRIQASFYSMVLMIMQLDSGEWNNRPG